jgi:RNA polymerase sigma factor (sigma-70 family)
MPRDFKDFINLLRSNDQEAWNIMRFEMEQIVEHWCKERLIEMLWVSDGEIIPDNKTQFFDEIFGLFKEKYSNSLPQFLTFKEFKECILSFSNSYISNGFIHFKLLLPQNHRKAWWRLDKDLKTKMVFWLLSEKRSNSLEAEQVYYNSLDAFSQALKQKKLDFQASNNLKSYIFRIAELKMYEIGRENRKHAKITGIEMPKDLSLIDEIYDVEIDIKIENLMTMLEEQEREILFSNYFHGDNLKVIAQRLKISEENCRVIKFRALKKMKKLAIEMNL